MTEDFEFISFPGFASFFNPRRGLVAALEKAPRLLPSFSSKTDSSNDNSDNAEPRVHTVTKSRVEMSYFYDDFSSGFPATVEFNQGFEKMDQEYIAINTESVHIFGPLLLTKYDASIETVHNRLIEWVITESNTKCEKEDLLLLTAEPMPLLGTRKYWSLEDLSYREISGAELERKKEL